MKTSITAWTFATSPPSDEDAADTVAGMVRNGARPMYRGPRLGRRRSMRSIVSPANRPAFGQLAAVLPRNAVRGRKCTTNRKGLRSALAGTTSILPGGQGLHAVSGIQAGASSHCQERCRKPSRRRLTLEPIAGHEGGGERGRGARLADVARAIGLGPLVG